MSVTVPTIAWQFQYRWLTRCVQKAHFSAHLANTHPTPLTLSHPTPHLHSLPTHPPHASMCTLFSPLYESSDRNGCNMNVASVWPLSGGLSRCSSLPLYVYTLLYTLILCGSLCLAGYQVGGRGGARLHILYLQEIVLNGSRAFGTVAGRAGECIVSSILIIVALRCVATCMGLEAADTSTRLQNQSRSRGQTATRPSVETKRFDLIFDAFQLLQLNNSETRFPADLVKVSSEQ